MSAIALRGIRKQFGGVRALDDVDLDLRAGTITGLVGENGSGKSTLIKVLTGIHVPEQGAVTLWGEEAAFPIVPERHGIGVVHQDLGLVETASILDNIAVGQRFGQRLLGPVPSKRLRGEYAASAERLGFRVDFSTLVRDLTAVEKVMVAVLRALLVVRSTSGPRLLVLDEATASLPVREAQDVLDAARELVRETETAVVVISHRLREVLDICDEIAVLRDGRMVLAAARADLSVASVVAAMLGRPLLAFYPDRPDPVADSAPVAVAVDGLSGKEVKSASFEARRGEILALVGLPGMGQADVLEAVCRPDDAPSGTVAFPGAESGRTPRIGVVPADRLRDGCWTDGTAQENMTLSNLGVFQGRVFLRRRQEREHVADWMSRLGVRPPRPDMPLSAFSGGNQQKVVFGRALQNDVDVLVLDEPTQGVDAGARKELLEVAVRLANDGTCVLLFSNDYEQVAAVSSRILVLRDGEITHELLGGTVDEADIISACNGPPPSEGERGTVAMSAYD